MAHVGQPVRGLLRCCTVLLLFASPALATTDQTPSVPAPVPASPPSQTGSTTVPSSADFLMGRPRVSMGVRGGWMMASAGSDIYDFITDQLTVDKSNFNGGSIGLEVAFNLHPNLDIGGSVDWHGSATPSEYRDWVDNLLLPIEQTTELDQMDLTASAKVSLLPRGRTISRYAWIPTKVIPYVGAGGGMIHYSFKQFGDFVDFVDNDVFAEQFSSSGWTPSFHAFGGADVHVFKRILLSLEGRYTWANAELDRDFIDFEPMDLGGFRFGVGFHIEF